MLQVSQKNTKTIQKALLQKAFMVLFLALLVSGGATSLVQAAGVSSGSVLRLTNESRKQAGLSALKQNDQLTQAAEAKAKDMFKNNYFAHTSPKGVTPWHWIKQTGYQYGFAGENLAINYESAESQHKAWMKSATHRANILSDKYQEIGVAVVSGEIDGKEALVTVQVFASPKVAPVVSKPKEYLPSKEVLVADVKGVEQELKQVVVGEPKEVQVAIVDSPSPRLEPVVVSEKTSPKTQNKLDLYIVLTLIMLQIIIFAAAMPFLYRATQKLWTISGRVKTKIEPIFIFEDTFVGIHAFDIHRPKAL